MEQNQQNTYVIPLAIVVAGGLIAAAVYFGAGTERPKAITSTNDQTAEINLVPVTEKDHIIGSRNAKLVIVEYSDTECPFCKTFHKTMKDVVQTYNGEVAWVYRHFPIAQLHSRAIKEAEATECATELGGNQAFWKYIDKVFETTNSNNSLDPNELPRIATAIGLDSAAFNTCLSSGKYTESITKSVEEAVKAGALGTPYSVIVSQDGQKVLINGAEPVAMVKAKIDALLK
ncbi:MAG: thioredoxin domain-containing protein [Candidatus Zambryskibacteria bacterium]|nr:thioredoxin domain-containing protein [Candidatus Zambryskibacteria bacterium]